MKYDQLAERIRLYRYVPKNDKEWLLSDDLGWTIAHQYAQNNVLPVNFPHWAISDQSGWTVAHSAAHYRKLPKGFSQWKLADNQGDTVAHIAARANCFPVELHFNEELYSLRNLFGETVLDILKTKAKEKIQEIKNKILTN